MRAMPCELDDSGFCFKCTGEFIPHSNTCFKEEITLCTYNVGFDVKLYKLLQFLENHAPDIICLHEMKEGAVKNLIENLRGFKWSKFTHCARSPHSRSIILSIYPMEEVCKGFLGSSGSNNQFITVKVADLYLTSLHFSASNEETRLKQIEKLTASLETSGVWDGGRRHIWAGDFNSLTEDDKTRKGWKKVAKKREASNREGEGEKGFKKLEEPKFDVTKKIAEMNFTDCWAEADEKGSLKETCK